MKQDNATPFTRRRLLTSLGTVGVAGALGGTGTLALLNDDESMRGNAITAGELDLDVGWFEWYNGEQQDCDFVGDNPGPIFDLDDVKPGDRGEASVMVHVAENPAYLWLGGGLRSDADNGLVEPERAVDDTASEGELADAIEATVWYDDDANRTLDADEREITSGTLADVLDALDAGIALDGDRSTSGRDCYEPSRTQYVGVEWELPRTVDNRVQSDSVTFDLKVYARQCRHADGSNNPFRDA